MQTILLNNQIEMPLQGIGTRNLADPDICEQVVLYSLESGIRLIDTSPLYLNEESIGLAISESPVERAELFITAKIHPSFYKKSLPQKSLERTLKKLRTDYVDLLLITTPIVKGWKNAWKYLEKAVDEGLARGIGVCNFYTEKAIDELCSMANIKPCVDQIECHPFLHQRHIQKKLNAENIQLEAWYPLGNGNALLLHNEVLLDIATSHHTTVPQIILRWHEQMGHVFIVKSSNPDHIQRNLHLEHISLTPDDMQRIEALDVSHNFYCVPEFLQKLKYSLARW
ncbi:aldo/keto reductase family protein [Butyrivibrio sp. JL13D10]|uniref:aldo/keto reductase family protein n=1 Tax=Butyrivibrio sp. JL13D10 TaxID=3236815 RepID=UPI0038B656FC